MTAKRRRDLEQYGQTSARSAADSFSAQLEQDEENTGEIRESYEYHEIDEMLAHGKILEKW